MNYSFTLIDHTADLGVIVRGDDLRHLFSGAAKSMMQIMVKAEPAHGTSARRLSVSGKDLADLMVCWLGEILYVFLGKREIVLEAEIDSISPTSLSANLVTVPFCAEQHEILYEIKAVTYHQIEVIEKDDYWESRIIFDL